MGFIYLISCAVAEEKYVGQTITTIETRWRNHRNSAKKLKKYQESADKKAMKYVEKTSYLYNSMVKLGIENFSIKLIVEVPNEELDATEIKYIAEYKTLRPNGYNLTTGGGHFTHHEETKKLMSRLAIEKAPSLIDKYRREDTKGAPMYMVSHEKGKSHGYAVCGHPLCSYNSFTTKDYETKEKCKEAAIAFLNDLVAKGVPYVPPKKKDPMLPTGITPFRDGYLVKRKINGIKYKETFTGVAIDKVEKLRRATEYLNTIVNKIDDVKE